MYFLSYLSFLLIMSIIGAWFYGLGLMIGVVGVVLFMLAGLVLYLIPPRVRVVDPSPAERARMSEGATRDAATPSEPAHDHSHRRAPSPDEPPRFGTGSVRFEVYGDPDGGENDYIAVFDPLCERSLVPSAIRLSCDPRTLRVTPGEFIPAFRPERPLTALDRAVYDLPGIGDAKPGDNPDEMALLMVSAWCIDNMKEVGLRPATSGKNAHR